MPRKSDSVAWYFADKADGSVRAILPAKDLKHLAAQMGCKLKELNIREANWNGTKFVRGKRVSHKL